MSIVVDSMPELKSFIGYKAVVKNAKSGKYYSTFTGQEIKVGIVPEPPRILQRLSNYWTAILGYFEFVSIGCYNSIFKGHTAVFECIDDLRSTFEDIGDYGLDTDYRLCIVEMVISGSMLKGDYQSVNVHAGSYIESIKYIMDYE